MNPAGTPDAARPMSTRGAGQNRPVPQPVLRTARLTLAPLSDEHLDLEAELDADPQVMRYLTGRASTRAEVERAHQRRLAAAREVPGLGFWAGAVPGAEQGEVEYDITRPRWQQRRAGHETP